MVMEIKAPQIHLNREVDLVAVNLRRISIPYLKHRQLHRKRIYMNNGQNKTTTIKHLTLALLSEVIEVIKADGDDDTRVV